MAEEKKKKRKRGRTDKATVFVTKDEEYKKFKEKLKSKGITIQGFFDNFIRKVNEGKIDILDVIKD